MIPKIIHYCWFTKENPPQYPKLVKNCVLGWKELMPDWRIKEWNFKNFDPGISVFTKEAAQYGQAAYPYISDYVRLWALYKFGGVWLDADQKLIKRLDNIVDQERVFFGMINPGQIGCGIIGAEPGNIVIGQLLDKYNQMHYIKNSKPNPINSVYVFTETLKKYHDFKPDINIKQELDQFTIYPKNTFYPDKKDDTTVGIHLGMTSHYKKVSVVMPVRNGGKYIKEAIQSVLGQTLQDFELVIVNDGSDDNTEEIIKSFTDDRIVYLRQEKLGISVALNTGIRNSIGLYIARMDSDDIMLPDRLEKQYKYFLQHPEIDILGAGFEWLNGSSVPEYFMPKDSEIEKEKLLEKGNLIAHPTVMFKKSSIKKLGEFPYEGYYNGAEDFKLWIKCIDHGLKIQNIPDPVIKYRQHDEQKTNEEKDIISQRIINSYTRKNNTRTELTCIIPFKNEGIEIEKTVASIRGTSWCNIILINDCSTDGTNYKAVAEKYGCDYVDSLEPLGVSGGRELGVKLCETEYFVLLDGHMRFYDDNWDIRVLKHLKEHPQSIITSNTSVFGKEKGKDYKNEDGCKINHGSMAARINMYEPGWEYSAKWTKVTGIKDYTDNLTQCSCVLGAFYASNKTWWNKIGGLQGLRGWGNDEPLCSIKTILAGGECLLLKDFYVGHLYRGKAPYITPSSEIDSNHIYLIELFTINPDTKKLYLENLKKRLGEDRYRKAANSFYDRYQEFLKFKNYFYSEVAIYDWQFWMTLNKQYE